MQYKAALAITGAIQGSYREKHYQELGLELLISRIGIGIGISVACLK